MSKLSDVLNRNITDATSSTTDVSRRAQLETALLNLALLRLESSILKVELMVDLALCAAKPQLGRKIETSEELEAALLNAPDGKIENQSVEKPLTKFGELFARLVG